MRITFLPPLPPSNILAIAFDLLPRNLELVLVDSSASEEEKIKAVEDTDFIMAFGRPISKALFDAASNVRLIQLLGAGYDQFDVEGARRVHIPVATNGGANSTAVAEYTFLLMLALYRKLPALVDLVKSGSWRSGIDWDIHAYELGGKTLGLIGLGSIGKEVARRALAFRMGIQYYDVVRPNNEELEEAIKFVPFEDLLRSSDIVSLHVPLNDQTRRLIGREALALMKPSAILINTSRGEVVDEEALVEVLKNRQIAGAGLDVLAHEPLRPAHPLLELDNVVCTPHVAGWTYESFEKRFKNAYANMLRVIDGKHPLWVVSELRDLLLG